MDVNKRGLCVAGHSCSWTQRGLTRLQTGAQWTCAGSVKGNLSAGCSGSPESMSSVVLPQGVTSPCAEGHASPAHDGQDS